MWTRKNIPDQKGKTVLVTGANVGLGYETALALYEAGAHVILACRNYKNAESARQQLLALKGSGSLEIGVLDLSDLSSVKKFADVFLRTHTQLDVLINNAGVATPPASKTAQGYELQFGVNFLGHFALTGLLYPLLKATKNSRIVTVTSMGYQRAVLDFENLRSEKNYDPMREYRQSKLANLIFSLELHRKIAASGDQVLSIAAQPGANKTELTRHLSQEEINKGIELLGGFMDASQGALSLLFAAVSQEAEAGNLYQPDAGGYHGYPGLAKIESNAMDEELGKKLWHLAEEITGVCYP